MVHPVMNLTLCLIKVRGCDESDRKGLELVNGDCRENRETAFVPPSSEQILELFAPQEAQDFLRSIDVYLIFFHGSRARGGERSDSDYDFAILLDDRVKWSFLERVERLDKCAEWIAGELSIPRDSVDVQDLDEVSLLFAFNVAGDGFLKSPTRRLLRLGRATQPIAIHGRHTHTLG